MRVQCVSYNLLWLHYNYSVLPQHGQINLSAVPSFSFNHQPHFIPMLTQQFEHSGVQQPITSKWTLLNLWQHFALLYTNTTASPVLESTKTKHWKKAIHSFWKNCAQSVLKSCMTLSSVLCGLQSYNLDKGVSFYPDLKCKQFKILNIWGKHLSMSRCVPRVEEAYLKDLGGKQWECMEILWCYNRYDGFDVGVGFIFSIQCDSVIPTRKLEEDVGVIHGKTQNALEKNRFTAIYMVTKVNYSPISN